MEKHYCGVFMKGYSAICTEDFEAVAERLSKMNLVTFETKDTSHEDVIGIRLRFPVEKIVAIRKLMKNHASDLGVLDFAD